jgi:ABC-type multidrug transport system fused ATPase/permease subunit
MKKWINKIDKQLLERFPLLWVTRAPWVLLVTLVIHLLFFALGWNVFKNPLWLQDYNADDIYIRNGILLLSIICSVLIVVVWLIVLFRHNAFKNYYPTSRWQLFASFIIYFIVLLISSTFYSSYQMGYKEYISQKYTDEVYNKKLDQANFAAAFLSFNQEDYTIDRRRYPSPFDTLYCEVNEAIIDFSKPYLSRYTDEYQFYTLKKTIVKATRDNAIGDELPGHLYSEAINDTTWAVWNKDNVVDVSALANAEPSYFNYSRVLFTGGDYDDGMIIYGRGTPRFDENQQKSTNLNQQVHQLLKRNNEQEIEGVLAVLLSTAHEFDIKTNLTVKKWIALFERDSFIVRKFIYNGAYRPGEWEYDEQVPDTLAAVAAASAAADLAAATPVEAVQSLKQQYFEEGRTNYYFDAAALKNVFDNIASIKAYDHWSVLFQVQCWLAFGLALLLFIFRTSGLSSLLFSIITAIVIAIAVSLVVVGLNIHNELVISYLAFTIGTFILVTPLFLLKKIRKKILAVFINISIAGFIPYTLLIIGIISMHQRNYYKAKLGALYYKQTPPPVLIEQLGMDLSTYLLIAGFLFMLLYVSVVKRWKALPEG